MNRKHAFASTHVPIIVVTDIPLLSSVGCEQDTAHHKVHPTASPPWFNSRPAQNWQDMSIYWDTKGNGFPKILVSHSNSSNGTTPRTQAGRLTGAAVVLHSLKTYIRYLLSCNSVRQNVAMTNKHSGVFILTWPSWYPFLQLTVPHFIISQWDNQNIFSTAGVSLIKGQIAKSKNPLQQSRRALRTARPLRCHGLGYHVIRL